MIFSWEAWKFFNQKAEDLLLLHIIYLEYNVLLLINNSEYDNNNKKVWLKIE